MTPHAVRAVLPAIPAVVLVLVLRLLEPGSGRTELVALGELVIFVVVLAAFTWLQERALLREALSYLRTRATPAAT